jgi:hypothetical protein
LNLSLSKEARNNLIIAWNKSYPLFESLFKQRSLEQSIFKQRSSKQSYNCLEQELPTL